MKSKEISAIIELDIDYIVTAVNYWMLREHKKRVTSYKKLIESVSSLNEEETHAIIVITVDNME